MVSIVFMALVVLVVVTIAVLVAMFINVAFAKPDAVPVAVSIRQHWGSPPACGQDLLAWATATAEIAAVNCLSGRRHTDAVAQLVAEMQQGASFAIDSLSTATATAEVACPGSPAAMIGVTAPEVLEISRFLRMYKSPRELDCIRKRAVANGERIAESSLDEMAGVATRCPLLDNVEACAAFVVRPIRCRGWCPLAENGHADGSAPRATRESPDNEASCMKPRSHLVIQGAERGVRQALKAAGLDDHLYEFNSALAIALEGPDATERWVHGERIFEGCTRYQRSN